ncbi:unnamed protein product [Brugia pahangi]|uniref:PDZ and LIM domain protein Zasp n=1 Tax=Brugia pahangi TaxID=6280 RepID=A0A0N4TN67_BRUPA|nr:unnamed protein product [Brugia pahangi]
MAQAEMVTVRMSRGQMNTPWGFDIGPELTIINIIGGSLADRAGLLNGDVLVELEGHQNLNIELAKQLLSKTEHRVELVVHRTGGNITHRIWQPSVTENTEYNKFQHSVFSVASTDTEKMGPPIVPLKVSLEHQNPESIAIPGFNVAAQPFGDHQEVKHLQYNSPMPLYSPQTAAEQYLQQTGGLFGTDPNLTKQKEVPSYLRSETLRLIQECERSKENGEQMIPVRPIKAGYETTRPKLKNISEVPMCFICGRNIKGVMCRAFDRTLHSDCFQCSTCGSSLKNQGHHFINDKFYCDIHGHQLRGGGGVARHNEIHWERSKMVPASDKNTLLTPYHPEITTGQSISISPISPTPWKTQSPISPNSRGVPPAATQYGHELNELRKEIYSSSMSSGDMSGRQRVPPTFANVLNRVRSLPLEIRKVTSLRRLPCKHHWPPASHKIMRYWQCNHLTATTSNDLTSNKLEHYELFFPSSKFIKGNEDKRLKLSSPKRYHLTPCDKLFRNPNYPGHMKQRKCFSDGLNYYREEKHKVEVKDMTSAGALNSRIICSCERGNDCSTNNIKEQKQQHKKEPVHSSSNIKMRSLPIKKVHDGQTSSNGTESPNHTSQCDKIGNIDLDTSEKKDTAPGEKKKNLMFWDQGACFSQNITVGDNEMNKAIKGNRMRIRGKWDLFDIHNKGELVEEGQEKSMASDLIELKNVAKLAKFFFLLKNVANGLLLKHYSNIVTSKSIANDIPLVNISLWAFMLNRDSYNKPSNIHEPQIELAKSRDILHAQSNRVSCCEDCKQEIRDAYVLANGLAYCPDHFICSNKLCGRKLLDIGFVEEKGHKYCERCFETEIAPRCAKCNQPIIADCLNALQKQWHPHCFACTYCHNPFGNSAFFLEQGQPYCETGKLIKNDLWILDWNTLFTTKCVSCHYPIEAGDRWLEALGVAFHSTCFNCTSCNVNLEGESFYAKNGAPYCKLHA